MKKYEYLNRDPVVGDVVQYIRDSHEETIKGAISIVLSIKGDQVKTTNTMGCISLCVTNLKVVKTKPGSEAKAGDDCIFTRIRAQFNKGETFICTHIFDKEFAHHVGYKKGLSYHPKNVLVLCKEQDVVTTKESELHEAWEDLASTISHYCEEYRHYPSEREAGTRLSDHGSENICDTIADFISDNPELIKEGIPQEVFDYPCDYLEDYNASISTLEEEIKLALKSKDSEYPKFYHWNLRLDNKPILVKLESDSRYRYLANNKAYKRDRLFKTKHLNFDEFTECDFSVEPDEVDKDWNKAKEKYEEINKPNLFESPFVAIDGTSVFTMDQSVGVDCGVYQTINYAESFDRVLTESEVKQKFKEWTEEMADIAPRGVHLGTPTKDNKIYKAAMADGSKLCGETPESTQQKENIMTNEKEEVLTVEIKVKDLVAKVPTKKQKTNKIVCDIDGELIGFENEKALDKFIYKNRPDTIIQYDLAGEVVVPVNKKIVKIK